MFTKNTNTALSLTALFLILVFIIIRVFGFFKIFDIAENSMSPTLKIEDKILITNILNEKIDGIIVFNYKDSLIGLQSFAFRVIGKAEDIIEIKRGFVYRNEKRLTEIETVHDYKITKKEYYFLKKNKEIISDYNLIKVKGDTLFICLQDKIAQRYNLNDRRFILPENYTDEYIEETYSQSWNKDFFGPLIIPEGKYFVLGDNRDNANDSRFIGLVDKEQIIGKVILKW